MDSVNGLAIAVVDPFTTGAHVARYVNQAGYKCVRMLSILNSPVAHLVQEGIEVTYDATIQHNDQMEDQDASYHSTIESLRKLPWEVVAVIPGAETGVELADILSDRMALTSNGEALTLARRNKYIMGETVREANVRAVKQRLCSSLDEVEEFLGDFSTDPFSAVVKPVASAGSDSVYLCDSKEEATQAFSKIHGTYNGLGILNSSVLVQEFLVGQEFVVDHVSKNGEHKLVGIWEYDKRPVNNSPFVYHGMRLREPQEIDGGEEMVTYARSVLDALQIVHGPSHMEVMLTPTGPCLVEV